MGSSFQHRAFEEQIQTTASESPLFPQFWEYLLDIPITDITLYTYQSQFLLSSKHLGQDSSTLSPLLHERNWSPVMTDFVTVFNQQSWKEMALGWRSQSCPLRPSFIHIVAHSGTGLAWATGHHSRKVDDGTLTGVSSKPNAMGKGEFPKENYSPVLPKSRMDADWWKVLPS